MFGSLPKRRPRAPHRRASSRWPEEALYLLTVLVGLALLLLATRTFHSNAAERIDALQQLRAARRAGGTGALAPPVGLGLAGLRGRRQWSPSAAATNVIQETYDVDGSDDGGAAHAAETRQLGEEGLLSAVPEEQGWQQQTREQQQQQQHLGSAAVRVHGAADAEAALQGAQAAAAGHASADAELARFCEEHFGLEWVQRWGATARQVCSASRQLASGSGSGTGGGGGATAGAGQRYPSTITCRSMNDTHMPASSAPHMVCDATNLRLDPSKLRRARCPLHRPDYLCISPTYHRYERGAWAADCTWPGFSLGAFSKDHQQDIFGSMLFLPELSAGAGAGGGQAVAVPQRVEELPTLLVTREVKEHANVYHTFTDLLNVYVTLSVLGWERRPRQVVVLDAHRPGPLDILWPVAAAGGGPAALAAARQVVAHGGHPWDVRVPADPGSGGVDGDGESDTSGSRLLVRRVEDFKAPVLFRHAAFVPPGYTSLLFAHLYEDASCPLPTRLFAGFRRFMLESFGLEGIGPGQTGGHGSSSDSGSGAQASGAGSVLIRSGSEDDGSSQGSSSGGGSEPVAITIRLISRRPARGRAKMPRQIGNEDELVAAMQTLGVGGQADGSGGSGSSRHLSVSVSLIDFAELSVDQQLAAVQGTDVLVGMHGAALAHVLLLPAHAALVELWPQADGIWRCYQNFAQWAGALYRRVANSDPARHRDTPRGDVTDIDAAELRRVVGELLPLVAARKQGAAAGTAGSVQQEGEVQEL